MTVMPPPGPEWREAAREEEVVEAVVALGRDLGEGYRIQYGKAVAELLPAAVELFRRLRKLEGQKDLKSEVCA